MFDTSRRGEDMGGAFGKRGSKFLMASIIYTNELNNVHILETIPYPPHTNGLESAIKDAFVLLMHRGILGNLMPERSYFIVIRANSRPTSECVQ